MAEILETPEHKVKENNLKKEKKKIWQQPFFFSQLIFQIVFGSGLILIVIISLLTFKSSWENIVFPELQKVNSLHHDLTILQAKVEQLSHTVQTFSHKDPDIENLKTQISTLQEKILLLEKESAKEPSLSIQAVTDQKAVQNLTDYYQAWEKLQKQLYEGMICIEDLKQLKSKIPVSYENSLQNLATFAETPAKTISNLRNDLEKVYHTINTSSSGQTVNLFSSTENGLWNTIGKYFSKWIHIHSNEKKVTNSFSLTKLEEGLKYLAQNQLVEAINSLENIFSLDGMAIWLEEAKRRQKCDQAVNEIDRILKTIQQARNEQ